MGPRTALGHPVSAPTSLKTIVFSLNLNVVEFSLKQRHIYTKPITSRGKSNLNIGALAVNGEWRRKVVESDQ